MGDRAEQSAAGAVRVINNDAGVCRMELTRFWYLHSITYIRFYIYIIINKICTTNRLAPGLRPMKSKTFEHHIEIE